MGGVGAGFVVEFEGVESREHEENQESKSEREEWEAVLTKVNRS